MLQAKNKKGNYIFMSYYKYILPNIKKLKKRKKLIFNIGEYYNFMVVESL